VLPRRGLGRSKRPSGRVRRAGKAHESPGRGRRRLRQLAQDRPELLRARTSTSVNGRVVVTHAEHDERRDHETKRHPPLRRHAERLPLDDQPPSIRPTRTRATHSAPAVEHTARAARLVGRMRGKPRRAKAGSPTPGSAFVVHGASRGPCAHRRNEGAATFTLLAGRAFPLGAKVPTPGA
jgi:hypothetical protein